MVTSGGPATPRHLPSPQCPPSHSSVPVPTLSHPELPFTPGRRWLRAWRGPGGPPSPAEDRRRGAVPGCPAGPPWPPGAPLTAGGFSPPRWPWLCWCEEQRARAGAVPTGGLRGSGSPPGAPAHSRDITSIEGSIRSRCSCPSPSPSGPPVALQIAVLVISSPK